MKNEKHMICSIFTILTLFVTLCGCETNITYNDKEPALYTQVAHSVIGQEYPEMVQVAILERDSYGRVLFAARCFSTITRDQEHEVLGLFIAQKVEEASVSYLEDSGFCLKETERLAAITDELIDTSFTPEEIEKLKAANFWEQPLPEDMTQKAVVWDKKGTVPENQRKSAFTSNVSPKYDSAFDTFLTSDSAGKSIYFVREYERGKGEWYKFGQSFFVIYDKDGEFCGYQEAKDIWNYQKDLQQFKVAYDWQTD